MKPLLRALRQGLAGLLLVLLVACGGRLTQASFEKVKPEMSTDEVKRLLGTPTEATTTTVPLLGTVTTYTYKTEKSEATVIFHDGKVMTKAGTVSE